MVKQKCDSNVKKQKCNMYAWEKTTNIYTQINSDYVSKHISEYYGSITEIIPELIKMNKTEECIRAIKFNKSITQDRTIKKLVELSKCYFINNDISLEEKFNSKTELLNFKNGCYDMKNNIFRARTINDYVCEYLDYDYTPSDINTMNELKDKMLEIVNDDIETLDLYWIG